MLSFKNISMEGKNKKQKQKQKQNPHEKIAHFKKGKTKVLAPIEQDVKFNDIKCF